MASNSAEYNRIYKAKQSKKKGFTENEKLQLYKSKRAKMERDTLRVKKNYWVKVITKEVDFNIDFCYKCERNDMQYCGFNCDKSYFIAKAIVERMFKFKH